MNFTNLYNTGICLLFVYMITFPFAHSESYFTDYPHIDTKFAPGFSEVKFNNIQPGFTKNDVLNILGEPLEKHEADEWSRWSYSTDGKCQWLCDLAWISYEINFDNEGKIKNKERRINYN